jgi:uncharacterized protein
MPAGELRRKDRETSQVDTHSCLDRAMVCRVGTVGPGGEPYVVPMNFVFDPSANRVYLHCATTGHLLDNLASNPRACFEVDEVGDLLATGPSGCDTSQAYQSVICFGRARIVEDAPERETALRLFINKYVDRMMQGRSYDPTMKTLEATAVIAIEVERTTGKRRPAV